MTSPLPNPAARLEDRAVIRIAPRTDDEDVFAFVQGLVTADVKGVLPAWSALLSPQGKVLFDFLIWHEDGAGSTLLIDCEAQAAEALVKRLSMYRLRRAIDIARIDSLGVYWSVQDAPETAVSDPRLAALGQRWIGPLAPLEQAAAAGSAQAWRAHRLHLGVCEGRAELGDNETLWLECNAIELNGVSFTKGCYVGQENTARMNWRQKINRRLVVVPLADSEQKRQRVAYPELGLAVDHLRIDTIAPRWRPDWMPLASETPPDVDTPPAETTTAPDA